MASSITRTLRIDEDLDKLIQNDAERAGMSPNALINKILVQYKDVMRYTDPKHWIMFSRETFYAFFDQLTIEQVEDIGYEYGKRKLHENLLRRGMEVNKENIQWYIPMILGEYSGWFRCDMYPGDKMETMHLIHNSGKKWGHFIVSYLSSILRGELCLNVESVIMENDVHLTIS